MDVEGKANWPTSTVSRLLTGHRLLACLFAIATLLIAFDGLIESGNLVSWVGKEPSLVTGSDDQEDATGLPVRFATLPIDHEDPHGDSFKNRYWINDKHFRPGGPVFVYDVGEDDASTSVERFLERNTSFMGQLMQEFGGLGILWEHRYYGESLPIPLDKNSTTEKYRFLTLNQSLADLPYFANNFRPDLTPKSTPWIMLGCSYSGTRAALSRLIYPETIFAAYAGEAPVLFNVTVNQHWRPLYNAMVDYGYYNCSKDLHAMIEYIDSQLSDPLTALSIKQLFFGRGGDRFTNSEFATAIGSFYRDFKNWGFNEGRPSVASLCDLLETDPKSNRTAGPNGIAKSYGPRYLSEKLALWPEFMKHIDHAYNTSCQVDVSSPDTCILQQANSTKLGPMDSWLWQQCSEPGLFIVPDDGPHYLFPHSGSWGRTVSDCQRFFPSSPGTELSDLIARVAPTNLRYGGLKMRPSNVFWSGGQYDVWRSLTPLAIDEVDVGPTSVRVTQEIPACGVSTGSEAVFGVVLPEAGHCAVIGKNTTQVQQARRLFADALHEWLKCFWKVSGS